MAKRKSYGSARGEKLRALKAIHAGEARRRTAKLMQTLRSASRLAVRAAAEGDCAGARDLVKVLRATGGAVLLNQSIRGATYRTVERASRWWARTDRKVQQYCPRAR